MKRLLLVLIVAALVLSLAHATDVTNCTNLTSAGGVYNLTANLSGTQSGQPFCIAIQADNVTFNCGWTNYLSGSNSGDTGIYVYNVNNVTITRCDAAHYTYGINLTDTYGSTLYSNSISSDYWSIVLDNANNTNVTSNGIWNSGNIGIKVINAHNNNFDSNSIHYSNNWDFRSESGATNNTITDMSMVSSSGASSVVTSFTYSGDVNLAALSPSVPNPSPYTYVGMHYIYMTNSSAGAWIFLNMSYSYGDTYCLNESSFFMARFNGTSSTGTWEKNTSNFSGSHGVNTGQNYVYANITDFGNYNYTYGMLGEYNGSSNCPTNTLLIPELSDYAIFGILILIGIAVFISKKYI